MVAIGLDVGTSLVKAVLFDEHLHVVDTAHTTVPVRSPSPGWSEQDLDEVLDAVCHVVSSVAPADGTVEQLAVTAQGDGTWLVDADARPVGPALLWNDARAGDLVQEWEDDGRLRTAFEVTGSYGNAGLPHAQLAWLRAHDPPRVERARHVLTCGSWVHLALTGRAVLERSEAGNPFLDASTGRLATDLMDMLGVADAARLLPRVVGARDRTAPLTTEAASRLGLRPGTPVVLAPYDVVATAAGVGAIAPGTAYAVLGTTLCVAGATPDPRLGRDPGGMALVLDEDRWLIAHATLSGTQVLDWCARLLGLPGAAEVVELAGSSAGNDAPLVLPYFSPAGERAPFRDPRARGALTGLDLSVEPADVARGVLDGLTLAVGECLLATGVEPEVLRVCGGGARSSRWCQLIADATGVPVETTAEDQVGALGAALVGRVALGLEADLDTAVRRSVRPARRYEPDAGAGRRLARVREAMIAARERGVHHAWVPDPESASGPGTDDTTFRESGIRRGRS